MRIAHPPAPLPFSEVISRLDATWLEDVRVITALEKARNSHLPWDKFRFQALPAGSHEPLWHYARLQRGFSLSAHGPVGIGKTGIFDAPKAGQKVRLRALFQLIWGNKKNAQSQNRAFFSLFQIFNSRAAREIARPH